MPFHTVANLKMDGVLGSADGKTYHYYDSNYGSLDGTDVQCTTGLTTNPTFPPQGGQAQWQCNGLNGGQPSAIGTAHRDSFPITFSASPSSITKGNSTMLSWTATSSCSSGDFNTNGLSSGTAKVSPTTTTTYTITCGGVSSDITVTVGAKTVPTYQEH